MLGYVLIELVTCLFFISSKVRLIIRSLVLSLLLEVSQNIRHFQLIPVFISGR
jgi:hypothetical protein